MLGGHFVIKSAQKNMAFMSTSVVKGSAIAIVINTAMNTQIGKIASLMKKEKKDIEKQKNLDDFIGKIAIVKKDIGRTLSIDGFGLIEYNNGSA